MGRSLTRVVALPYVRESLRLVHITGSEMPMLAGPVHTTGPRGRISVASEWPVDTHGNDAERVGHSLHSQCSHVCQLLVPYGTGNVSRETSVSGDDPARRRRPPTSTNLPG